MPVSPASDLAPVLSLVDGRPMTTSLAVAAHFEKRHTHVLDSVREIMAQCPAGFNEPNFRPVAYTDAKGEKRPSYNLSRDGFSLLVMGFTGKKALAWKVRYIEAFNAMEGEILRLRGAGAGRESLDDPGGAHRRIKPGLRASALHSAVQVAKMSGGGEIEVERLFERYCALFADRDPQQPEDCPWPEDPIYEQMDRFADECMVETPGAKTRAKDVWEMFLRWWASQGEGEQPSWQMLGRHLGRRYCKYKRGGVVNYHGVSVRRPHYE